MKRVEVDILFTPEAEREFDQIQRHERLLVREWAQRYLEDLILFPPEDWLDIHPRLEGDCFKADNHVPFDIQGRLYLGKSGLLERIIITRFRLKTFA